MTAERAWGVLAAAIVAYELAADEDQLLSNAVDRWIARRPYLTHTVVAITAAHLLNLLPERVDPFHNIALVGRRRRTR